MEKLEWEKFSLGFHESWHPYMRKWVESKDGWDVMSFLKEESRKGKTIAPISANLFRCFAETPLDEVKVVIAAYCPYHTIKHNRMVADGLCMSASNHLDFNYIPPSLHKFYEGLEREMEGELCLPCVKQGDLSYLAHQGVLMYNVALTTEIGTAGAHQDNWFVFSRMLFEDIISHTNAIVVLLGAQAQEFTPYLRKNDVHKLYHPASAAYKKGAWDSMGVFTRINKSLKERAKSPIIWLPSHEELEELRMQRMGSGIPH